MDKPRHLGKSKLIGQVLTRLTRLARGKKIDTFLERDTLSPLTGGKFMVLDDAQKQQVALWIADGLKLSEIQNRLASDFGIRMTYMDVRILMSELQLKPKDTPAPTRSNSPLAPDAVPKSPAPAALKTTPIGESELDEAISEDLDSAAANGVTVSVDHIARVGALASGKVTFSDGQKAEWYLDQYGRLGLAPDQKGYKPTSQDVMSFQAQLQNVLSNM